MKKLCFKAVLVIALCLWFFQGSGWAGSTTTSGVTAQTIIDRVRVDLNETTASFWTDAQLLHWADEAVKEVVYKTRCLETGASNIVLSGQGRSYALSGITYLDIEKVEYDSGVTWIPSSGVTKYDPSYIYDLDRVPFGKLRYQHEKEQGSPKTYAVWNNNLYIWPIPATELAGTTLYVYYLSIPSGFVSGSSSVETPAYFDWAIVDYVKAKALAKDGDPNAEYFMKRFDSRLIEYMLKIQKRYEIIQSTQPTQ